MDMCEVLAGREKMGSSIKLLSFTFGGATKNFAPPSECEKKKVAEAGRKDSNPSA